VNRSNAHECKSRLPCLPQFFDSPFSSSSRMPEIAHHDSSNFLVNTPLDDMLGEGVEVVGSAGRLLLVQPGGLLGVRVVTPSNQLAESSSRPVSSS